MHFRTLFIAFRIAMAYCIIDGDNASSSVILRYAPETSRVKTSSLGSIKLLIALKDI